MELQETHLPANGNTSAPATVTTKPVSLCRRILSLRKYITVEPILCCYLYPVAISFTAGQKLYLEKSCLINLNISEEICNDRFVNNNPNLTDIESQAQAVVSTVNAWKSPLGAALPALLLLFIGSWSDRRGVRKPLMLIPVFGELCNSIVLLVSGIFLKEIPMEVTAFLEGILTSCSGSYTVMLMGAFSYVADVTTEDERTLRIGIVSILATLGAPVGIALSATIYEKIGYYVFAVTTAMYVFGVLYGVLRLKDVKRNVEPTTRNFLVDFFDPKHVLETITVPFKKRENNGRIKVLLVLLAFIFSTGPSHGDSQVQYFYPRLRYDWNDDKYVLYLSFSILIHLLGAFLVVGVFNRYLKMSDAMIGVLASCNSILGSAWSVLSPTGAYYYWTPVVDMFSGSRAIATRSLTTKVVPNFELGKMQSVFSLVESLMDIAFPPIYNLLYAASKDDFIGACFVLSGTIAVPAIFIYILLIILQKSVDRKKKNDDLDGIVNENFRYVLPAVET